MQRACVTKLASVSDCVAPWQSLRAACRFFAEPAHKRKLAETSEQTDFGGIRIADVIKEKLDSGAQSAGMFWCKPEDRVYAAITKMADANVGSILVMKSGKPVRSEVQGLITERDYLCKVAVTGKSSKDMACSALMTPVANLVDITPQDTVAKAMRVMETRKIRHLPVYDGEELLGMLSIKDIISTFIGQHESNVGQMSEYIGGNTY